MEAIRQYLISIIVTSVIIRILCVFFDNKGMIGTVIRLLGGIILVFTLLSPLTKFQLDSWQNFYNDISSEASAAVSWGQEIGSNAAAAIIKEELETYIQDKASAMQLQVDIQLELSETYPQIPQAVTIEGAVSPYGKRLLAQFLSENIGIPEENQIWN